MSNKKPIVLYNGKLSELQSGDDIGLTKWEDVEGYGSLYNWYAATDVREISSDADWTVPTKTEVETLLTYLGGAAVAGDKLKETGIKHWEAPNTGATDEINFKLLPSGYRKTIGDFQNIYINSYFWTSTAALATTAYQFDNASNDPIVSVASTDKIEGKPVRLVRAASVAEQLLADGTYCADYVQNDLTPLKTVKIGTQVWTAENLSETKFRNGDAITEVTDDTAWGLLATEGFCYYDNNILFSYTSHIQPINDKLVDVKKIDPTAVAADTPIAASKFHFWDTVNLLWKYITWANIQAAFNSIYLKLDQTTPDVIINGFPTYEDGHGEFTDQHQLIDKEYVDSAVAKIGASFFLLDAADAGIATYKSTSMTASALATATVSASANAITDTLIEEWVSPVGMAFTILESGVYDLNVFVERTGGNRDCRIFWRFYEYKADTTEVLISESNVSELITSLTRIRVYSTLVSDYTPTAGSRLVGKVYLRTLTNGTNTTMTLSYQGTEDSHWEIPVNQEFLEANYAKVDLSNTDISLTASKTLAITNNTTLNGGTHSGNNTGDQDLSGKANTSLNNVNVSTLDEEVTPIATDKLYLQKADGSQKQVDFDKFGGGTGIYRVVDENGNDMAAEPKFKIKGGIATDDAGVKTDIDVQHYPQQFRLTLETGNPYSTTDQSGKTEIFLTPYEGGKCTIYDGTDWITYQLTTDISILLTDAQTGTTTNGQKPITGLTDTSQLVVGMEVTGTGIPAASTIASIDSATQITMNNDATADGTVTVTFKVPASKAFDIYLIKGTSAPELRMVFWNNYSTPITNSLVNGIEVSPSDNTWLYVGSGSTLTSTAGQTSLSTTICLLKNRYKTKTKRISRSSTTSHTYNNSTSRKWNNDNSTELLILMLTETIMIGHQSAAFDATTAYGGLQVGYSIVGVAVSFGSPQILTSFNSTLSSSGIFSFTKGVYNFYVGERVFSGTVTYYNTILNVLVEC